MEEDAPMTTAYDPDDGGDTERASVAMPAWAIPARRSDDIGRLSWQLLEGGEGGLPDFTAAAPLVDAIREGRGELAAIVLEEALANLLDNLEAEPLVSNRQNYIRHIADRIRNGARRAVSSLLYDTASVAEVLSRVVELSRRPAQSVSEGRADVTLVFADIGRGVGRGQRVRLPDGRRGIVVVPPGEDGRAGVMPLN